MNEEKTQHKETVQLVRFTVGDEEYGVPIEDVQEIVQTPSITPLPNSESFVKGIINLRGHIVPVIDMHERLNIQEKQTNQITSRVIIILIENKLVGLIVDSVSQVIVLAKSDIEEPPQILHGLSKQYIEGIGKTENSIIIILKLSKILTATEIISLNKVSEKKNNLEVGNV